MKKHIFLFVALSITLAAIAAAWSGFSRQRSAQNTIAPEHFSIAEASLPPEPDQTQPTVGEVLGDSNVNQNFWFESKRNGMSNGGVAVLNAGLEPVITIAGSGQPGTGSFQLYKASKNDLLSYLTYKKTQQDAWQEQIQKVYKLNPATLEKVSSFEQAIALNEYNMPQADLRLPIEGEGIWFLQGNVNGATMETMLIRSNLGGLVHEGDNQSVFWVQDSATKSVGDATIELFNLENTATSLQQLTTNQDGLAVVDVNPALDVALVAKGDSFTLIPVSLNNLQYKVLGNSYYSNGFTKRQPTTTSFIFTDRYLYKPGDMVHFKAIMRQEDDVQYSIQPETLSVTLGDYQQKFVERTMTISELGTLDGDLQLPADTTAGYYEVTIWRGQQTVATAYIQVAQYRKPSATLDVSTDKLAYLPGEKMKIAVRGMAFLGQPLRNQTIAYKVYQDVSPVGGDYQTLRFTPEDPFISTELSPIHEGTATLDSKGEATISLPVVNQTGLRQFWLISVQYLDATNVATTSELQALVHPGDFVIESAQSSGNIYVDQDNPYNLVLQKNHPNAKISGIEITGKVIRYPSGGGEIVEQENLSVRSDDQGKAVMTVWPKYSGRHELRLESTDAQGNYIKSNLDFYPIAAGKEGTTSAPFFKLTTDKSAYNVGDVATISVETRTTLQNAFVSVGRSFSRDYRVIPVSGGKARFTVPIVEAYQPNVYVMVGSFSGDEWLTEQVKLPVNTLDKKITVSITPDKSSYGPGETAQFKLVARDGNGRPVQTDMAFWIFDKSLLSLQRAMYEGIFNKFWQDRWFTALSHYSYQGITSSGAEGGGGCFTGDTPILMADGSQKAIEQVKPGDQILTFLSSDNHQLTTTTVAGTHHMVVPGYLILNGTLRVTPEHKLLVNGKWATAGTIKIGDALIDSSGAVVSVRSIEWLQHRADVYNLNVDTYHTFIAGNIYVHNDKGDSRTVFKDTAYWNPHVMTDANGEAQVTVQLPDNLTTWVAAAVSASQKTEVGNGEQEFIVTKSVVTTPIIPPFLRVGDRLNLSALVQNFTPNQEKFTATAEFSAGSVVDAQQQVTVGSQDATQVDWPVTVNQAQEKATFKVAARGTENEKLVDEVTTILPVYVYGFWQRNVAKIKNSGSYQLPPVDGADQSKRTVVVRVQAQPYPELATKLDSLSGGGLDDVRSSAAGLIAATILAEHGAAIGSTLPDNEIRARASKSLESLKRETNGDGVWYSNYDTKAFDPELTGFVIEALTSAEQAGVIEKVAILENALRYVGSWQPSDWSGRVEQQYVFSLYPNRDFGQGSRAEVSLEETADDGLLARAVLANARQGFGSKTDAEQALISRAVETPTQLSWKDTTDDKWMRSLNNLIVPSAYSIRALQALGISTDRSSKALNYLWRLQQPPLGLDAIQALTIVDEYKRTDALQSQATYAITLAGKLIDQGKSSALVKKPAEFTITAEQLATSVDLNVEKSGLGNLYTTITTSDLVTDQETSAQDHNISITRKYLSTNPANEPTKPGDLVLVQFEIAGLGQAETGITILDYLPSGLVAIDETMMNDDFERNGQNDQLTQQLIVDQGMKLTTQRLFANNGTYTYKTRVVAAGAFAVPPATVWLEGDPSIWAQTASSTFVVDGKQRLENLTSAETPAAQTPSSALLAAGVASAVLIVMGGAAFMVRKRKAQLPPKNGENSGPAAPKNEQLSD